MKKFFYVILIIFASSCTIRNRANIDMQGEVYIYDSNFFLGDNFFIKRSITPKFIKKQHCDDSACQYEIYINIQDFLGVDGNCSNNSMSCFHSEFLTFSMPKESSTKSWDSKGFNFKVIKKEYNYNNMKVKYIVSYKKTKKNQYRNHFFFDDTKGLIAFSKEVLNNEMLSISTESYYLKGKKGLFHGLE